MKQLSDWNDMPSTPTFSECATIASDYLYGLLPTNPVLKSSTQFHKRKQSIPQTGLLLIAQDDWLARLLAGKRFSSCLRAPQLFWTAKALKPPSKDQTSPAGLNGVHINHLPLLVAVRQNLIVAFY